MRVLIAIAAIAMMAVAILALSPQPGIAQGGPQTFESDVIVAGGVDGPVWISELVGDELWIGGEFTGVRDPPFNNPVLATQNLAVININTGLIVQKSFDFDGPVYGIEYHDGTVWVVGNFDNLNSRRARNIVAIDFATNQVIDTFVAEANAQLRDVEYHQGWLYLAGNISTYNNTGVGKVLRVDPDSGMLDTSWSPNINLFIEAIETRGNLLIAGERANSLGTETKLIDIPSAQKLEGFDPAVPARRGVWDATFAPDGQSVYSADLGNTINKHSVSDVLQWYSLAADGDMQAVAATASRVYAGFHEGWRGNSDRRLIALDPTNGREDTSWYVEMNSYWGVRDIQIYDQGLVVVGEFSNVNGINARRVAIFRPEQAWSPAIPIVPPTPTPIPIPAGDVNCDYNSNVLDAMVIAQYGATIRTAHDSCPLPDPATQLNPATGDVNNDSAVNILDALLIAQCSCGITYIHCPPQ